MTMTLNKVFQRALLSIILIVLLTLAWFGKLPIPSSYRYHYLQSQTEKSQKSVSDVNRCGQQINSNPSSSTKQLSMIFVVGVQGSGHYFFNLLFNELNIYSESIIYLNSASKLSIALDNCWEFNSIRINNQIDISACNKTQNIFNNYSNTLQTKSILILSTSFSYPYKSESESDQSNFVNYKYPDIITLIEFCKNAKQYPFNLRLLVLNNDYKNSLQHICNIPLLSHMLTAIHTQLLQIDAQLWIQLNYTKIQVNPMDYTQIFTEWFNIELNYLQKAIQSLTSYSTDTRKMQCSIFSENELWAINQSFYSLEVSSKWPLFSNQKYIITPETVNCFQTKRISSYLNLNDVYSNYIRKDYKSLHSSSKKLTMIFVIGVEGVGHHFMRQFNTHLETINPLYKHQGDRPNDKLWLVMDKCWAFDIWAKHKESDWLFVDVSKLAPNERDMWSCDIVTKRFNHYSSTLPNNTILFLTTHYSYTYDECEINGYPDIIRLINWTQNAKPYPIDLRILVFKRDYATSLTSGCLKRFGKCETRIPLLSYMLNTVNNDLLRIDKEFWIGIDFTHLTQNVENYSNIFSQFLNINLDDIQATFRYSKKRHAEQQKKSKNRRNIKKFSSKEAYVIHQLFYSDHIKNRWPLLTDKYYTVYPDKIQFLSEKKFLNDSNYR